MRSRRAALGRVSRQPVVLDAGPPVALVDVNDQHHRACARWLANTPPQVPLVVSIPVLTEVCHLVDRVLGPKAEAAFVREIATGGRRFRLHCPGRAGLRRVAETMDAHSHLSLGYADAVVLETAAYLGTPFVATVDRRDFGRVVPRHVPALILLPDG